MRRVIFLLSCLLLVSPLSVAAQNTNSPLGTNLMDVTDWAGDYPFADAFKSSREWIAGSTTAWSDGSTLNLDANGWIRSLNTNQVANNVIGAHGGRPGYYTVLYDGEGTIQYIGGAIKVASLSGPGRDVVEYRPASGAFIFRVVATNPQNYMRNIRMYMPGGSCDNDPTRWCDASTPCGTGGQCRVFATSSTPPTFNPDFLKRVSSYKIYRFMNWIRTNYSTVNTWAQRPRVTDATWGSPKGVPLEVMIDLSNLMRADPWFCIPEAADDDYVRQTATVVRDRLASGLKAYVEYTNEAWNGAFPSSKYTQDRGMALGLAPDRYLAGTRYYSQRSVEIFNLFRPVVGAARMVGVLSGQAANAYNGTVIMDWRDAYKSANAYAIAPYFGYSHGFSPKAETAIGMTVDQFMNVLETQDLPEAVAWMQANATETTKRGIPLIAYEGGQHLAADYAHENNAALNALFDAANLHPRMQTIYARYLLAWKNAGGRSFVHFLSAGSWSKYGRWGALRDLYQPTQEAPKFLALEQFIRDNPRWWSEGSVDTVAPGRPQAFQVR